MFREMRRNKQILSVEEMKDILMKGTSGVLAVYGDDGYPYAVPLSYVFHENSIFFHCAKSGHKIDAITNNNKVSFCVTDQDIVVPEEYTTYFRSIIIFGKAHILNNEEEKRKALEILAERFTPDNEKGRLNAIDKWFDEVCLIELEIDHMTGKEAIELVREKHKN